MKKTFDILEIISEDEIIETLGRLGKQKLTPTGHGFEEFGEILIKEAAIQATLNFTNKPKEKPAIGLLSVVLAANRDYNKVVEPNLKRIEEEQPGLKTFNQLSQILSSMTNEEFFSFWGHKDQKKYSTLKSLLAKIEVLKRKYLNAEDDFDLMNRWSNEADLLNFKNDVIGGIPNIGIATFQHLRMVFGVDTVKPDQRVKEVLNFEFGLNRLAGERAIMAVEQIASIARMKVITVDQILVKFGSSHYNQRAKKLTLREIVQNFKKQGVDNQTISKATFLTLRQVERI